MVSCPEHDCQLKAVHIALPTLLKKKESDPGQRLFMLVLGVGDKLEQLKPFLITPKTVPREDFYHLVFFFNFPL